MECVICNRTTDTTLRVNRRARGTGRTGPKFSPDVVRLCGKCRRENKGRWRYAAVPEKK